jgi:Protein of unknown function (DUF3618)
VITVSTTTPGGDEPRDPDAIEADIAATRQRLAGTITELQDRVSPRNLAQRRLAELRNRVVTSEGQPRPEALAAAAVLVLGLLLVLIRRARRR